MFASCCGAGCCFLKIISSYFLTRGWDSYNALCDIEQDVLEREECLWGYCTVAVVCITAAVAFVAMRVTKPFEVFH